MIFLLIFFIAIMFDNVRKRQEIDILQHYEV